MIDYYSLAEQLREMHNFYPTRQMFFIGNLIQLNFRNGYSLDQIAEFTHIPKEIISDWFTYEDEKLHVRKPSKRMPTTSELNALAHLYRVDPDDFYEDNTATWVIFHPARWEGLI